MFLIGDAARELYFNQPEAVPISGWWHVISTELLRLFLGRSTAAEKLVFWILGQPHPHKGSEKRPGDEVDFRELKHRRRRRQRGQQKRNRLRLAKQQLCTCSTRFLFISLPSLHDYDVRLPHFTFYGGREHVTTISFFSFVNSDTAF